jgi:hypothetical protein
MSRRATNRIFGRVAVGAAGSWVTNQPVSQRVEGMLRSVLPQHTAHIGLRPSTRIGKSQKRF